MVFFNDPVPCPDPAERAVKMAMAMREAAGKLITDWRRHSYELGFGAGIAQGYATLGQIGFSERSGPAMSPQPAGSGAKARPSARRPKTPAAYLAAAQCGSIRFMCFGRRGFHCIGRGR
jgi:hypothetical protein